MTNKEILAELKISYENLNDIRENSYNKLTEEQRSTIKNCINELSIVYSDFRETLSDEECMINLKDRGTFYIGNCISEDYSELYDSKNNCTYWVTCLNLDYFWYEDMNFLKN